MFRDLIPLRPAASTSSPPICRASANPTLRKAGHLGRIADAIDRFTRSSASTYALYVFDYGAPTGFGLAVRHPDRITAIISQNGNAYERGLSDGWNPDPAYWQNASAANREGRCVLLKPETTVWQYTHAFPSDESVSGRYSLDISI